ncbi:beta-ketoacyl-ACP synthase III [Desulfosarcina sp.]|uniref:beta-ketoacyl-ACP synthase III n=1 Tax=Desulfosarcina sp. TaxID=2027861 RepID=UPI003970C501
MRVFINRLSAFLPNSPVSNDEIETVLGQVDQVPSRAKRIVLKNNGILKRYYAVDRHTQALTHTNAQLAAEAVKGLAEGEGFNLTDIQCLCCGTTSPDLLFPGHALMVLGELGLPPLEAVTTAGICISGMTAFKYACMNVATRMSTNAVSVGSELSSSFMRSNFFSSTENPLADVARRPTLAFDSDFLRWMLSDGAGAALLSDSPNPAGISLRVDWIDNLSYAGELETCMYGGGIKGEAGNVSGWRVVEAIAPEDEKCLMAVKQDIRLLEVHIVATMQRALQASIDKHGLQAEKVDWFVPHYSSVYFRDKFFNAMAAIGFEIPYDRWFTNLAETGNTGSASIFIILEALFSSGRLKPGQRLLGFVPESGRFSHCFMHLTVV